MKKQIFRLQLLTWLTLVIALYCFASYLEKENRVTEYPTDEIADELQLREMEQLSC